MVKFCIIDSYSAESEKVLAPHIYIAKLICEIYGGVFFLATTEDLNKYMNYPFDKIFYCYGSYYHDYKNVSKFFSLHPHAKAYWITNEYNLILDKPVQEALQSHKYSIISNFEEKAKSVKYMKWDKWHMVNLNALKMFEPNPMTKKEYPVCYYGTFRVDRQRYFMEYMKKGMILSTSLKNLKKYRDIGCNPTYFNKFFWGRRRETLNLFKYSLYIEDETHHEKKLYNHPANRYYEALYCNVVQFFDDNCRHTFERYGLDIPDFYWVGGFGELMERVTEADKDWETHHKLQLGWVDKALKDKQEAIKQFGDIINEGV